MAGAREVTHEAKREELRKARAQEDEETGALQARRDLVARREEQRRRNDEAARAQQETDAPENNLELGTQELRRREMENQEAQRQRNEDAKAAEGAPENKALSGPPQNKGASLEGVAFASSAAREEAESRGMSAETFKRRRKSSDNGFTKADVERIAAATDEADEGEE